MNAPGVETHSPVSSACRCAIPCFKQPLWCTNRWADVPTSHIPHSWWEESSEPSALLWRNLCEDIAPLPFDNIVERSAGPIPSRGVNLCKDNRSNTSPLISQGAVMSLEFASPEAEGRHITPRDAQNPCPQIIQNRVKMQSHPGVPPLASNRQPELASDTLSSCCDTEKG